jgi:hypothetical protein
VRAELCRLFIERKVDLGLSGRDDAGDVAGADKGRGDRVVGGAGGAKLLELGTVYEAVRGWRPEDAAHRLGGERQREGEDRGERIGFMMSPWCCPSHPPPADARR